MQSKLDTFAIGKDPTIDEAWGLDENQIYQESLRQCYLISTAAMDKISEAPACQTIRSVHLCAVEISYIEVLRLLRACPRLVNVAIHYCFLMSLNHDDQAVPAEPVLRIENLSLWRNCDLPRRVRGGLFSIQLARLLGGPHLQRLALYDQDAPVLLKLWAKTELKALRRTDIWVPFDDIDFLKDQVCGPLSST